MLKYSAGEKNLATESLSLPRLLSLRLCLVAISRMEPSLLVLLMLLLSERREALRLLGEEPRSDASGLSPCASLLSSITIAVESSCIFSSKRAPAKAGIIRLTHDDDRDGRPFEMDKCY